MKSVLIHFAALIVMAAVLLGQNKPSTAPNLPGFYPPDASAHANLGPTEILNDTMGVDFGAYLARVLHEVKRNWHSLLPEVARPPMSERGAVAIQFAIRKDGHVDGIHTSENGCSGDPKLDGAAWDSITASSPFPALPAQFTGEYLALRLHFYYNLDPRQAVEGVACDLETPGTNPPPHAKSEGIKTPKRTALTVTVTIFPRPSINVPVGGSAVVTATVKGSTNTAVSWKVSGLGCSGARCGTVSGGLYLAPSALPRLRSVTLTATSEADPNAWDYITVNIGSAPQLFH